MSTADQITIVVGFVLLSLWVILFGLTLHDRKYKPKHRWVPRHRRTRFS